MLLTQLKNLEETIPVTEIIRSLYLIDSHFKYFKYYLMEDDLGYIHYYYQGYQDA